MCEGLSKIDGPIPPHPMFLKELSSLSIDSSRSNNSLCVGPSKISGPIVADYGFESEEDKNRRKVLDYTKYPRVGSAGKSIFDAHKNGNGLGLLLQLQGRSFTPRNYKTKPKNHMAINTYKIRQLMTQVKERQAQQEREKSEKSQPVKALWKSSQFKDVPSKLKESLQQQPLAPREPSHEFLRAHSKTGSAMSTRPQSARPSSAASNAASVAASTKSKDDIDFIKHNQLVATQFKLKRAPSVEQLKQVQDKLSRDLEKYHAQKKGKVPNYIEARKADIQKQQEEYVKSLPDPEQPPGHRKLLDEERKQTLALLKEKHQALLTEINTLPIRNDTHRLQTTKSELDKKLAQIDEAIKIFSKPKVFVKIDS